jgi:NTE family protein
LVLGAGGAKGLAHIPVLKLLDDLDIPIDCIVGTSIGGVLGGLYAIGYSGSEIEEITANLDWEVLFRDLPSRDKRPYFNKKDDGKYQLDLIWKDWVPSPPQGLIFGQNIFQVMSLLTFPYATAHDFDRLPVPFRCVTVDLVTGRPVVLEEGSLALALRATMAIPTVFSPVTWDRYILVDGGILNTLPVDVAREMGADIVIAVDLSAPLGESDSLDSANRILAQSIRLVEHAHKRDNAAAADILIHPDMTGLGAMDFFSRQKLEKIREAGRSAAQEARAELIELKGKHRLSRSRRDTQVRIPEALRVGKIRVTGNTRLTTEFILSQFGIQPGESAGKERINRKIQELYSLGYFEHIHYEMFQQPREEIELVLNVKELPPGRLRLGLRYDNLHKLVGITGVDFSNLFMTGMRFENELQVFGLTRFRSRLYFTSRTLNLPVYPLLEARYRNIPTRIYDGLGERSASYNDRAWNLEFGIGFLPAKWLNAEVAYRLEAMDLKPTSALPETGLLQGLKDSLRQIVGSFTWDTLDDVQLPGRGMLLQLDYEGSFEELGSDLAYDKLGVSLDGYLTFSERHTGRIYAFFGRTWGAVPYYKYFNLGRPRNFVGMQYDQLVGSRIEVLRGEYRFKYNESLNLSIMGNVAFNFAQKARPELGSPLLWGCGAAVLVGSPLGVLEVVFSLGSRSLAEPDKARSVLYVILGTHF